MVVLAYFNIAQHVSIWCDTFLRVFNKVQHVDIRMYIHIYRHTYIKRSLAFSLNKNCVNDIYTYIT